MMKKKLNMAMRQSWNNIDLKKGYKGYMILIRQMKLSWRMVMNLKSIKSENNCNNKKHKEFKGIVKMILKKFNMAMR